MDIEELRAKVTAAWDSFIVADKEAMRTREIWCYLHLELREKELEQEVLSKSAAKNAGGSQS